MLKRHIVAILTVVLCLSVFSMRMIKNKKETPTSANAYIKPCVILDAGHGGFDGGAVAPDGTLEKDINLAVTLKLDAVLRLLGYETVLVRSTDTSTAEDKGSERSQKVSDMKARLKITEKYKDALFVSIHMNKYTSTQPHGAQVFYANTEGSKELAECIQMSIADSVQPDNKRVIKKTTKDIYLLYNATVPSVITECGFLSNRDDLSSLKNDKYQIKLAAAIAAGINDYYYKGL